MVRNFRSLVCILASCVHFAVEAIPTMREALLAEAKHRLNEWFLNPEWTGKPGTPEGRLDYPKEEFGIQLVITSGNYYCDSESKFGPMEAMEVGSNDPPKPDAIPITFGRFDVKDADVIDVFNALADTQEQAEWDALIQGGPGVTILGDFPKERARGASLSFVAKPFPDRQVMQWQVYNASKNWDDMWTVFSTRRNDEIHKLKKREAWPAVQAHNCLGAYNVKKLENGGCHVVYTTMVNPHAPWPITPRFVFNLAWTKTVDYIQSLRARAQYLKKRRLENNVPAKPVIPDWLLYDGMTPNKSAPGTHWFSGDIPKVVPPYIGADYIADVALV
eukprot:TRINITY_DN108328_c0_g1_i1.p1 TRINITY_DN108328_c0_g1~~TRINITY_DN108328_c0_g1_i1.p1  ORF type:complete len:350 (+),score=52.19 TRINITY_DN108328_c0_g1_i1:55-1050(+)